MAKVNFKKLSLGHMLQPSMVWDNLNQCAAALSGSVSSDQREENRSVFTLTFYKVRVGRDEYTQDIANQWWDAEDTKRIKFSLPPLQEYFDESLVSDFNTPDIKLESISLSFDGGNQHHPIDLTTGIGDPSKTFDQDMLLKITAGNFVGQVGIPRSVLIIDNNDVINRPNPALSDNINAVIDPYSEIEFELTLPISTQNTYAQSKWTQLNGIDSLVVNARFSAPLVQRDRAGYTVIPQNAPLHDCARSSIMNTLVNAVPGDAIEATTNSLKGVQEAFNQLDRQVRSGLRGGLTRWSEVRTNTESLIEDQGYFCITVPLFNVSQVSMTHDFEGGKGSGATLNQVRYANLGGYVRPSNLRSVDCLMDRAVVPIVAPGTIHHIGVFWDKTASYAADEEIRMDLGVALGCGARAQAATYTQIAQVAEQSIDRFSGATPGIERLFVPVAYSSHASAPAMGKGYVPQGRPFYFGPEIDTTGGTRRRNVADPANTANAEAAPNTNGTEQFFEIRCNLYRYNSTGAGGYVDFLNYTGSAAGDNLVIGNWTGIVVCLYGKMALVE